MSDCWSMNDKLFVDAKLEVFWFDLSFASSPSQPLPVERRSGVVYDGPKGDKFKNYLSKMGFRVNNKGRVIVATAQQDDNTAEAFHHFLLDKVVPLGPYEFTNKPLPRWKETTELETLLRNTKAELAKKNEEIGELKTLLNSIKVESQKGHLIDGTAAMSRNPEVVKFPLSNRFPIYTVEAGDDLDHIARNVYSGWVTRQQIAEVNNISNVNLIQIGQKLRIPLPSSFDEVDEAKVVHYGPVVAKGTSVEEIAAEYGTDSKT